METEAERVLTDMIIRAALAGGLRLEAGSGLHSPALSARLRARADECSAVAAALADGLADRIWEPTGPARREGPTYGLRFL